MNEVTLDLFVFGGASHRREMSLGDQDSRPILVMCSAYTQLIKPSHSHLTPTQARGARKLCGPELPTNCLSPKRASPFKKNAFKAVRSGEAPVIGPPLSAASPTRPPVGR